MVYSGWLFVAVIFGMGLGYFVFGHISMKINMENVQARTTKVICAPGCSTDGGIGGKTEFILSEGKLNEHFQLFAKVSVKLASLHFSIQKNMTLFWKPTTIQKMFDLFSFELHYLIKRLIEIPLFKFQLKFEVDP